MMFQEFSLYYGSGWSKPKVGKRRQANGKRFYWLQIGPFTAKLALTTTGREQERETFEQDLADETTLPN